MLRLLHTLFIVPILLICTLQMQAQTRMVIYDGITGLYNVSLRNDTVVINTVLKKSPAHRQGIRMWDQILSIDRVPVSGRGVTTREVHQLLNGKQGEVVDLVIRREGREELLNFSLSRDPYLSQIHTFEYKYFADSLNRWTREEILSGRIDSLFVSPLEAKITVFSVKEGSGAAQAGIRPGDRLISLAEEMDKEFYFHISHPIVRTLSSDSTIRILRGDSLIEFDRPPSPDGTLEGITSRFEHDMEGRSAWLKITTDNRIT
mgnify:CR=1 FL=1